MIVEPAVLGEELIHEESYKSVKEQLLSWDDHDTGIDINAVHFFMVVYFLVLLDSQGKRLESVDFVICVGGDGTLLYTSSMFQVLTSHLCVMTH